MATDRRRGILQAIIDDPATSTGDLLRAIELSERLDVRPDADPDFLRWKEFAAMSDEQLDRELVALSVPVSTGPCRDDDEAFWREVEVRARQLTAERTADLLQEAHRLRTALAEAEARLKPPPPGEAGEAPRSAPSRSGAAAKSDRPLRVVPPDGIDLAEGWSMPSDHPVLSSFERKVRGLPEA